MKKLLILIVLLSASASVRAQILAEVYRNIDCANCRQPDDGLEQFVAQNPNLKITTVYLHTDFPSPVDPFFLASQTDVSHRFYDVYQQSSTPLAAIDGFVAGTSLSSWKQVIGVAPSLPVTVSAQAADTNGIITVHMHIEGGSGAQVRPYVMLLESKIIYDNQKSYGKLDSWDNIFRAMIPGKDGGDAFTLGGSHDFTYTFDVTGKGYIESNLSIVAFVQEVAAQPSPNNTSYLIDGFGVSTVTINSAVTPQTETSVSLGAPMPNPSATAVSVPFTLPTAATVKIVVSDELGREVATIANGTYSEGSSTAVFNPQVRRPGVYVVTMSADGVLVGTKKIVLQ